MTHAVSKVKAQAISKEIEEAVTAILEYHGLAPQNVKWRYGYKYQITIEGGVPNVNEAGVDLNTDEAKAWIMVAPYSYRDVVGESDPAAWLGLEIVSRGERYRFVGYNTRARKMPFQMVRVSDGAPFKFGEQAKTLLIAAAANADLKRHTEEV